MKVLDLLKSFEGLEFYEQLDKIDSLLEQNGFTCITRVRRKGTRRNLENFYYTKDGVDYVFGIIYNTEKDEILYTLLDYKTYKKYIEPNENVMMNYVKRTMGDWKITLRGKDNNNYTYINIPLHRLAVNCKDGQSVDHRTHNACINIAEYLTPCINAENCKNKKFYSKVEDNMKSFSVNANIISDYDRIALLQRGFDFKRGRVYSPEYASTNDMYEALNQFESKYLGAFRYNPLVDFTDTWYALVLQKMLEIISDAELYEYNRNFMIANHKDIAEYYQLAM